MKTLYEINYVGDRSRPEIGLLVQVPGWVCATEGVWFYLRGFNGKVITVSDGDPHYSYTREEAVAKAEAGIQAEIDDLRFRADKLLDEASELEYTIRQLNRLKRD